jgi:acetolactate synthase I/II/III large subunit
MEQYTGNEAFIEVLNANGVEEIFINPGGDIAPVQTEIMKYKVMGKKAPRLVLCLDESVALSAAHGHYMVSGKPQVVMVHTELGTQQLGGALHNAQWGRVPVIIWCGTFAAPQRVTWKNDPYDQGSIVRNNVKWDHELTADEDIHTVLQHAFDTAMREPCGPVYLSYAREVLTKKFDKATLKKPEYQSTELSQADMEQLENMADIIMKAENPLIVAGYTARYPENVKLLVELAETICAPVLSGLTRMNFPTDHPLSAGIEQMGSAAKPNTPIQEADVVLAIDYDPPYVPAEGVPKKEAKILHIDTDPLTQGRPLWGRGADIFIKNDARKAMPALTKIVKERTTPERLAQFRERFTRLEKNNKERRAGNKGFGESKSGQIPISADWLCNCIARAIDEDTILVNQTITHSTPVAEQIERTKPGTLLNCAGGSIQFALGAALGAKAAAPDKTVVSLMTDGGFVWGCPVATLWTARAYKAPFLSVIFDNQSYGAIKRIVKRLSETDVPDDIAFTAGVNISPPADYAIVARSCGGYGRIVEDPGDVLPALREALQEVRNGRTAVLDVRLDKG